MRWWDDQRLAEPVPGFGELGLTAFTTTRHAGSFSLNSAEPSATAFGRWLALGTALAPLSPRLAFAHQVHGTEVVEHHPAWRGLLQVPRADGHLAVTGATGMAVTLADCVPVYFGHRSGVAGVLHSGWRGTAAGITRVAIALFEQAKIPAAELHVHCGPAICGRCYQVSPEVYRALTGRAVGGPTPVDLRDLIAESARAAGVRQVTISSACTRCHNDRYYSHRCGDAGRQVGVIVTGR